MTRIRDLRWDFSSVLPREIQLCLHEQEVLYHWFKSRFNSALCTQLQWFNKYSRNLASYMRSIGGTGLDLTQVNRHYMLLQ